LAAVRGVQFGLNVRVGEEDEIERASGLRFHDRGGGVGNAVIQERNGGKRGGDASGGQRLQKFSAVQIQMDSFTGRANPRCDADAAETMEPASSVKIKV
jgi:hypothetical protein